MPNEEQHTRSVEDEETIFVASSTTPNMHNNDVLTGGGAGGIAGGSPYGRKCGRKLIKTISRLNTQ